MTEHAVTFKFKDGDKEKAEYYASEADRDLIVQFLEYAIEANLVYYEGSVSHDRVLDLITSLKKKDVGDGVLTLNPSEFWELHVMYSVHEDVTDQVDDFPVYGFSDVFDELHSVRDKILTKRTVAG